MPRPNWVVDLRHRYQKGHWPDWVMHADMGLQCVYCMKGGHPEPRWRRFVYAPDTRQGVFSWSREEALDA